MQHVAVIVGVVALGLLVLALYTGDEPWKWLGRGER